MSDFKALRYRVTVAARVRKSLNDLKQLKRSVYMVCTSVKVKDLKKGAFFTLKDVSDSTFIPERVVWVRGDYDRTSKNTSAIDMMMSITFLISALNVLFSLTLYSERSVLYGIFCGVCSYRVGGIFSRTWAWFCNGFTCYLRAQ